MEKVRDWGLKCDSISRLNISGLDSISFSYIYQYERTIIPHIEQKGQHRSKISHGLFSIGKETISSSHGVFAFVFLSLFSFLLCLHYIQYYLIDKSKRKLYNKSCAYSTPDPGTGGRVRSATQYTLTPLHNKMERIGTCEFRALYVYRTIYCLNHVKLTPFLSKEMKHATQISQLTQQPTAKIFLHRGACCCI